jgi:hypothetical protein
MLKRNSLTHGKREGFFQILVWAVLALALSTLVFSACATTGKPDDKKSGDFYYQITGEGAAQAITITGYRGKKDVPVQIPSSIREIPVTAIGDGAFKNLELSVSVSIPNSVITIGNVAFADNRITNVQFGTAIQTIGDEAFARNRLASVNIPRSIKSIGSGAFQDNQITQVQGSLVFNLASRVFMNNKIAAWNFGTLRSYGEMALAGNPITNLTLVANTELAPDSFDNDLAAFYNQNGKRAETYVFTNNQWRIPMDDFERQIVGSGNARTITITGYKGEGGSIVVPERIGNIPVTAIGAHSFERKDITSVTFPAKITSIGEAAFQGNRISGELLFSAELLTIGEGAFAQNRISVFIISNSNCSVAANAFDATARREALLQGNWRCANMSPGTGIYSFNESTGRYYHMRNVGFAGDLESRGTFTVTGNTITMQTDKAGYAEEKQSFTRTSNALIIGRFTFERYQKPGGGLYAN